MATQYTQGGLGTWGVTSMWSSVSGGPYTHAWVSGNAAIFEITPGAVPVSGIVTVQKITLNVDITLSGSALKFTGSPIGFSLNSNNLTLSNLTVNPAASLIAQGSGVLFLIGTLTGISITCEANTQLSGSMDGDITVVYGTLNGTGSCSSIDLIGSSTGSSLASVAPGTPNSALTVDTLQLNGYQPPYNSCNFIFNGPAYSDCDHIDFTTTWAIQTLTGFGTTLNVTLGYAPSIGDQNAIVHYIGTSGYAGAGYFYGLPEGSSINLSYGGDTYIFSITYVGGSGYDIVLTCLGNACTNKVYNINSDWF